MLADLKNANQVLSSFGAKVIAEAKNNAPKNTGTLADSLAYTLLKDPDTIGVKFTGVNYAQFQDQGVQGSQSSAKAPNSPFKFGSGSGGSGTLRGGINKWVVQKNLEGVRDAKGRFIGRKGMIFLISRSIYTTGLRPTLFFTKPFERERKALGRKLEQALGKDYENELKVQIKGENLIVK